MISIESPTRIIDTSEESQCVVVIVVFSGSGVSDAFAFASIDSAHKAIADSRSKHVENFNGSFK